MIPRSFEFYDGDFLAAVALAQTTAQTAPRPLWEEMMTWDEDRLAQTDPAILNLEVARGIPAFADLEVEPYCRLLDETAVGFARWLPAAEQEFEADPAQWEGDLVLFRLGMLCQYIDQVLGIRYNEDQRDVLKIQYTDPRDLFLNGVLETRQGTCGNMAVLYLSLCWRLGWPVYLALTGWHEICRYADGTRALNIETTAIGLGGFLTRPDEFYIKKHRLVPERMLSGSDLTALKPRQMLGCFFGSRGRCWYDCYDALGAVEDYRRATELFPQSQLWKEELQVISSLAYGKDSVWQVACPRK